MDGCFPDRPAVQAELESIERLRRLDRDGARPPDGAARQPSADPVEDLGRRRVLLRMEDHVRPARAGGRRDVDPRLRQVRLERGVASQALALEEQGALEAAEGELVEVERRDRRDRLRRQDEPANLQPAVGQDGRLGLAAQAVPIALESGERSLLAQEPPAPGGRRPEHEVVDRRTVGDGLAGHETAQPQADQRDAVHARAGCEPGSGGADRTGPGVDSGRIARRAGAVADPRQVDAERRVSVGRQAFSPGPPAGVRRDLVPAPRPDDEDRGRGVRARGRVVERPEDRVGRHLQPDRARSRGRDGHAGRPAVAMATRPSRLSAVSAPPAKASPAMTGRSEMVRDPPGSTEKASSDGAKPAAWIRTPYARRRVATVKRTLPFGSAQALAASPRRCSDSTARGRPAGKWNACEMSSTPSAASRSRLATIASWAGGPNRYAQAASTKCPMSTSTSRCAAPWADTSSHSSPWPTGRSRSEYRATRTRARRAAGPSFAMCAMTPPMPSSTSQIALGARIRRRW